MKLTIGMIVKNEEKWLEKCLTAIEPILDNVDCELIITDTGSTDRTVEIAKRFTDKVLYFEWCNDFAAARNTALDIAKGEWFMFLDADEIFKSCNGIVDFFNSGEYSEYRSAAYTIRNLTASGTGSEFWARRMTRIDAGTRFESAVHEHLNTFGEPVKYLNDMAYHYGYLYQSDEDKQRKFDRNYDILKKKFDKVKDSNPMVYSELYDMLATVGRQKEADEYMDAGIRLCIKLEHPLIILFYCKKARHLLFEQQNEAALEICDKYFSLRGSIKSGRIYSDAEILVVKATALYRLKDFKQTVETLVTFFDTFNDMKSGKLDTKDKMYGSLNLAGDSNYIAYVGQFLDCCLKTGQYEKAAKYMSELPIGKYSEDRDTLDDVIALEIVLLEHVGAGYLDAFIGQLDEYGKQKLIKGAKAKFPAKSDTKHIKLTIGMIVKNEEKWLEKCLTAIKPILDNVDSELIITDTGSTDRTVEIAEKYADKVLHFEWIRDFSAARNTVFEVAKGEWFMVLDADDIFTSCDNIINFFNSGEYKKYNSATYISRNLSRNEKGLHGDEFYALRMTKILPQTKYVGVVHENLSTAGPPYKNLKDIADHYGYLYETEEDKISKINRNIDLLQKKLETEKDNDPMIYVQLFQAYMTINNDERALFYLNKGLGAAQKVDGYSLISLYYNKIVYYYNKKNYDKVVSVAGEYFSKKYIYNNRVMTTDGEVLGLLSGALYRSGKFSEAIDAFEKFFILFADIRNETVSTYDAYLVSLNMCTDINFLPAVNEYLDCCIKTVNYKKAYDFILSFQADEFIFEICEVTKFVKYELDVLSNLEYKNVELYYNKLDEVGKKIFVDELFGKLSDADNNNDIFFGVLSGIAKGDKKLSDKIEVYKSYYQNGDTSESFRSYFAQYGAAEDVDLICIAMLKRYDISCIFTDGIDIKRLAYSCCKGLNDFYSVAEQYDFKCFADKEKLPQLAGFYKYIMDMALLSADDKSHIPELLRRFADCGRESGSEILQAAALVRNVIQLRENRRYKECIAEIKHVINVYDQLGAVLSEYSKLVLYEYEKAAKTAQPQNEMQVLAAAIKKNIRTFIATGNFDAARKTLNDYRQLAPDDPDITELMNELN